MKHLRILAFVVLAGFAMAVTVSVAEPIAPSPDPQSYATPEQSKKTAEQPSSKSAEPNQKQDESDKDKSNKEQLPKTASPLPLIGLTGLLSSAGLLATFKRKR